VKVLTPLKGVLKKVPFIGVRSRKMISKSPETAFGAFSAFSPEFVKNFPSLYVNYQ
jgi:hypothetical protein